MNDRVLIIKAETHEELIGLLNRLEISERELTKEVLRLKQENNKLKKMLKKIKVNDEIDIMERVRYNLKFYTVIKGMTYEELSKKIGVSENTLKCLYSGSSRIGLETLLKITKVLNISVKSLFE